MFENLGVGVVFGRGVICVSFINGNLILVVKFSLNVYICKLVFIFKV